MKKYAYIRVSSKDQNIARQVEAMEGIGILEQNMFIDKQSGKNFYREQYQLLLKQLQPGDELYIKSIDVWGEIMMIYKNSGVISQKRLTLTLSY